MIILTFLVEIYKFTLIPGYNTERLYTLKVADTTISVRLVVDLADYIENYTT